MDPDQLSSVLADVDPLVWLIAGAVLLLLVVGLLAVLIRRRRRRQRLRDHYGAEYDHTARRAGSPRRADQDLLAREERRRSYEVREFEAGERERFHGRWEALQASFVDGPQAALQGADALLGEVAETKGYDASDGDPLRDVGMDHPLALDRYRAARADGTHESDRPDTELLRQAMLGARELFETLVGRERPEAASASAAFSDLVEDDAQVEEAPTGTPERTGDDGPLAEGPTGEMPLYGPDGRPLGREASGDHRR